MEGFINYLKKYIEITQKDIDFLNEHLTVENYNKGDVIFEEGKVADTFYFNQSGLVRLYYTNEGVENTAFFYTENQFVSAYESFMRRIPARQNFQALEPTSLVAISFNGAQEILQFNHKFEFLAMTAMEEELIVCQRIIESLLSNSPEERYLLLMKTNPEYFERIPQHYIASFIGVKPESLSRIKKRYFNKLKTE